MWQQSVTFMNSKSFFFHMAPQLITFLLALNSNLFSSFWAKRVGPRLTVAKAETVDDLLIYKYFDTFLRKALEYLINPNSNFLMKHPNNW